MGGQGLPTDLARLPYPVYGDPVTELQELEIRSDGPVRIVTINRPDELNAVNRRLHLELAQVWRQLRADRDARAVVLTGAGRTFCAGGDFAWLLEQHEDELDQDESTDEGIEILFEMMRFPLPVIAAVNGPAVGLGCSVAIMCDIVLIAENTFLADPHISVGLVAGDGGAAVWPLLTSLLRAKEYLFTGDRIPAAEAVAIGLATRTVPAESLMDEALKLARRLAEQPRRALQDTKRAMNAYLVQALTGAAQAAFAGERTSMSSAEYGRRLRALNQRQSERAER